MQFAQPSPNREQRGFGQLDPSGVVIAVGLGLAHGI
jgi:hypothetical protein